ncbi:MAG: hypothetical protein QOF19_2395 [Alphaproteobacteria bacterium]|nr:hypothetical protein [Alphaproteobacteria bacterium]
MIFVSVIPIYVSVISIYVSVIPATAGIHIPESGVCGTMGPRFRGDDK